jgi:soluble lytic murein transglycosylase-like protein
MGSEQEDTVNRLIASLSIIAVSAALAVSTPALAKKKAKEAGLFDECPVSETIRVPSDASLAGLESLAACDDVEVAEADANELPQLPSIRITPQAPERTWRAGHQTADLPADFSDVGKARGVKNSQGQLVVSRTATGTPYARIVPEQDEVQPEESAYAAAVPAAGLPGTLPAVGGGVPLSGEAILAMRPVRYRTSYDDMITQTAHRHRIDPLLLHAVIKQESAYKQFARSHVGAQGLMQIMPGTGAMLGVARQHLNDPSTNVDAGARLLRKLAIKYNSNFDLVLAAYNAGEGAVQKYGNRIPPYRETQDYVRKVMGYYYQLLNDNVAAGAQR